MAGWGKLVAGAIIGVAGTVYATNEEVRKQLPKTARDLPDAVRRRFGNAVAAAREASTRRREEILRDLEAHGGDPEARAPETRVAEARVEEAEAEETPAPQSARGPLHEDDTHPIARMNKE
ncbi:MAG: hypothetical protein M3N10_02220 [Actinomycetota bacterium]|nr:hypothetical protein [Actinomycetota bacterium]HZY65518.1 hypothetical protein [Rubrobacteraceae bacterium]